MKFSYDAHWFGLKPPEDIDFVAAFGCRALLDSRGRKQQVDILWDRKQIVPSADVAPPEFISWLNSSAIQWLNGACGAEWINPAGDDVYRLDDGRFHAIASARKSYGYLYVGVWMDSDAE